MIFGTGNNKETLIERDRKKKTKNGVEKDLKGHYKEILLTKEK